jgi:hypothetical protein
LIAPGGAAASNTVGGHPTLFVRKLTQGSENPGGECRHSNCSSRHPRQQRTQPPEKSMRSPPHATISMFVEIMSARYFATRFRLFATDRQKLGLKRLTAVYRETRGWLGGRPQVGDVPFPAGNFTASWCRIWQGLSNRRKAASGTLSVVDPAELRLAVCLSRRYDPIARPFGN